VVCLIDHGRNLFTAMCDRLLLDKSKHLHLIFIDLEKEYDRLSEEILLKNLKKKRGRIANIQALKNIYEGV